MAKFDTTGFEDIERLLLNQSSIAARAAPLMLKAGAEVLIQGQKAESERMGIRRTGDFISSIGIYKEQSSGALSTVIILPKGKDRKNVSNTEKGFILHYGLKKINPNSRRKRRGLNNRNIAARPWMDSANEKYGDRAHQAMRDVWERMSNGI